MYREMHNTVAVLMADSLEKANKLIPTLLNRVVLSRTKASHVGKK